MDSTVQSVLAVECGSVTTTAVLIEQVEKQYRLVATGQTGSTYGPPWQDISLGVIEAIRQVEAATNRILLAPGGWPITPQGNRQQGIDAFVVVSSAGPPLRLTLAGLMEKISLTSARRAAAATYASTNEVISLDSRPGAASRAGSSPNRHSAERRIQALLQASPEAIFLVGGTDDGANQSVLEVANALAMALQVLPEPDKPPVLYAGNSTIRPQVAEILGPVTSLTTVDNVRPALDVENVAPAQLELEKLYIQRKLFQLPGLQKLANWSKYPITPASRSFEKTITYISRQHQSNVIGVHIGSGATVLSAHTQDGQATTTVGSDAGVGHSLTSLLKTVSLEKFQRWLPFPVTLEELDNRLLNKSLQPASVPTTYEELLIEQAIAREGMRLVVAQARNSWPSEPFTGRRDVQWNLLIGAGRTLTRTPQPGHAALMLLDGVEPWGVTSLALDVGGLTNLLGAVAAVQPVAAVELAALDTFLNLGTVIAPVGYGSPGQSALKLKVNYLDAETGNATEPVELEVAYGTIEVIELPPGQKATLEIRPARHLDIGRGQPGRGALIEEVEGGILGIIIDARGRPLRLPRAEARRHEQLTQWLSKLDGVHATAGKND
jgi:hypothetical protein